MGALRTLAVVGVLVVTQTASAQGDGQAGGAVVFEDTLLTAPGVSAGDQFGFSVAVAGDLVVVGANRDNAPQEASGAVYVFDRMSGAFRGRVRGNDTGAENLFGDAVAAHGGRLFVGAPRNETAGMQAGAFYGFDGGTLQQEFRLLPERTVFVGEDPDFGFYGFSVDADDELLVVGAPGDVEGANGGGGAVYVYNAADRSFVWKLFASDAGFADNLGRRVATAGGIAIASSPFDDDSANDGGAVYLFDGSTGEQFCKIRYPGTDNGALFGLALAADGDELVVGAPFANDAGTDSGVVYVFDLVTGALLRMFTAASTDDGDSFGRSVAIDGDLIVVGATGVDGTGAAYAFDRSTGREIATLRASDGQVGDSFGRRISVSGGAVLVGAPGRDALGDASGGAYLFTVDAAPCPADVNGDGVLTGADFNAWLAAFNDGDARADQNGDGELTGADFNAFLANFNDGCS